MIKAVNPHLDAEPELVNEDPFDEGWLVLVETSNWEADKVNLLEASAYFERMKAEAEEEAKKL